MRFFDNYWSKDFGERLTRLRNDNGLNQSALGNASQVSQIEKGQRDITRSILYNLKNQPQIKALNINYEEIIFGDLNKFVAGVFHHYFSLILFKDLNKVSKGTYIFQNEKSTLIQYSCLQLAKTFSDFNIQRKNFDDSDDLEMDTFHKADDFDFITGGKVYNLARSFRKRPINEKTVIDFVEMCDILWTILGDKLVLSFKSNVCEELFKESEDGYPGNFRQDLIDTLTINWWIKIVSIEVFPLLTRKFKENPLFNIGYMVDEILEKMYKPDIPKSYLRSVPLKIQATAVTTFATELDIYSQLSKDEQKEYRQIIKRVEELLLKGKDVHILIKEFSREKLEQFGLGVIDIPAIKKTEERTFDEILDIVTNPNATTMIRDRNPIEYEPLRFTDYDKKRIKRLPKSMSELELSIYAEMYSVNLDNTRVKREIEGLLTNNSQVTYYFQEQLNEELVEMALYLNDVQNAFIRLLSKDEIKKFAL